MKKLLLFLVLSLCCYFSSNAQRLDHVQGDVIVQMKPGENVRSLARNLQYFNGQPTRLEVQRELSAPMRIWLLRFDYANIHETHFLNEIKTRREVQVAQLNHLITLRDTVPNDPAFPQQWQWKNTGQNGGTIDADVDADEAWSITTGGKTAVGQDIVVCVVEGANRNHVDLQGNLWFNTEEIPNNGIDDDSNGYVDDYNGWNPSTGNDNIPSTSHGTQVSGMIGAKGNNALLVTGINWDIKIMHVRIGSLNEANVIASYTYPLVMRRRYNQSGGTQGAFVVATNSSWGIDGGDPDDTPLWCAFYDSLGMEGILSCGATANLNVNIDDFGDLPTTCPSEFMVAVTATNFNDIRSYGYGIEHIDVAAPGVQIVTISGDDGIISNSGTSFATPLTAGIIALMYSAPCASIGPLAIADPAGTALMIRDALYEGVDKKPNLANEVKTGGRVNAFNSLNLLLDSCSPCPAPFGINVTGVIDTTATLTWLSTDSTLQTNLRWRMTGDTAWTEVDSALSPVIFNGLLACTQYEFQLQDICADTTSGFTALFVFKTDGCCEAPKDVAASEITDTSALVSWNFVLAANSYNLLLTSAEDTVLFEGLTGLELALHLEPCTDYGVRLQTVCDTGLTDFGTLIEFTTLGCGACTDQVYCLSNSENATSEWIANVTVAGINNSSGSDGGYGDFTGISTDLTTFQAYDISLTPGFSSFGFNEWFKVWIDFNQDGDFDDPGEDAFNAGGTTQSTINGLLIVPGNALPGLTRMRVVMKWNVEPLGPCVENFDFGEVEDYCVNIVEGTPPDCVTPDGLGASNITYTGATLIWNPTDDAINYSVRFRKTGTLPWTPVAATGTSVSIQNLQACIEFEFQVRSNCVGTESDWSESFEFTTECYPPCIDVPTGLDTVDVTEFNAKLFWNATPNAQNYRIRYKKATDQNWLLQLSNTTSFTLTGLTECTNYECTVQALCLGNQESEFADVFTFKTECLIATHDRSGDLEAVTVFPNPFTSSLTVGFTLLKQQAVTIELFDARGQLVFGKTGDFAGGSNQIIITENVTGYLPDGVYLVKMSAGEGYLLRKVVKK
jgi:serine protease